MVAGGGEEARNHHALAVAFVDGPAGLLDLEILFDQRLEPRGRGLDGDGDGNGSSDRPYS